MDNGTLVAITSLLSASIAGGITLISKYLDNKQKKNEQAMVIKTTYINKKIEAGQAIIGANSIRMVNRNIITQYIVALGNNEEPSESIKQNLKRADEKLFEINIDKDNYAFVYFDIEFLYYESYEKMDLLNKLMPLIEDSDNQNSDDERKNISDALNVINELLNIYQRVNQIVRHDLSKYDIV